MRMRALCALGASGALILAPAAASAFGWSDAAFWLQQRQQEAHRSLTAGLRLMREDPWGGRAALVGASFLYGVLHALGPGHGKALVAAYAVAARAPARRAAGLALTAALAQAVFAVVLVYGLLLILDRGGRRAVGLAEGVFTPLSAALMIGLGLWLAWRGLGIWRSRPLAAPLSVPASAPVFQLASPGGGAASGRALALAFAPEAPHMAAQALPAPSAAHEHGPQCGCAHGPDPAALAAADSWRARLAVVAATAVRPCTGALMLLTAAWAMGWPWTGVLAALAMGLGVGAATGGVALGFAGALGLAERLGAGRAAGARRWAGGLAVAFGLALALMGGLSLAAALTAPPSGPALLGAARQTT
ncbi:nickel/cobalt transporter [Neomegalonema perideroedes]|uniref:nickel/cobalt transporter n=1 Tax=Neomegalonema perideroedes TaxID=217219 RepID=UPI0003665AC3|nr:hypothetical protein [Neomegalonema perideroedes]